jgi:hypothetical protein
MLSIVNAGIVKCHTMGTAGGDQTNNAIHIEMPWKDPG